MPDHSRLVQEFLEAGPYAVAGASNDRSKFGNKVLRAYLSRGIQAYPIPSCERAVASGSLLKCGNLLDAGNARISTSVSIL